MRRQTSWLCRWADPASFQGTGAHPSFETHGFGFHQSFLSTKPWPVTVLFVELSLFIFFCPPTEFLWNGMFAETKMGFPMGCELGCWHECSHACIWLGDTFVSFRPLGLPCTSCFSQVPSADPHFPLPHFGNQQNHSGFSTMCTKKKIFCSFHNF